MRTALAAIALMMAVLPAPAPALAQGAGEGGPSIVMRCQNCGIIESVREAQQRREGVTGGAARMGFVVYIPVGQGHEQGNPYVGSVGSKEWQNMVTATSYEFTVRMDDGQYQVVQREGVSDLRVGERVRVSAGHIQRWQP
jgi:outer membrane lipoprotein SlyB